MASLEDEKMAREEPVLSIICAGARPGKWGNLCDELKVQNVPFEICMVGPTPPEGYVPPWFHYWYSQVKPHQAQVAAACHARGKLLCYFNDDWIIKGANGLGKLVNEWHAQNDEQAIVAPHMEGSYPYLSFAEKGGPLLPFGDVFSREMFLKRGGWDQRFIGIYASNDYAIEMQQAGKPVKIMWDHLLNEISEGNLWDKLWEHDRSFLDWLWMHNYTVTTPRERSFDNPLKPIREQRRIPVLGYDLSRNDLLYVHQGPHGKWQDTCHDCWEHKRFPCEHVTQPAPDKTLEEYVVEWEAQPEPVKKKKK